MVPPRETQAYTTPSRTLTSSSMLPVYGTSSVTSPFAGLARLERDADRRRRDHRQTNHSKKPFRHPHMPFIMCRHFAAF